MRLPGAVLLAGALVAALGFPAVAPVYHTTLMLPFMAYAIALLGLNLLFGYTGLVSFGHALFLGLGAYTGAVLTSHTQIRSLEAILLVAAVVAGVVAAPVGALCVRYAKIYFGMLTLAFGMLFYTFVVKFYHLTGGDEGMRFLRPTLLGQPLADWPKTAYLAGPYYYYSLALLVLAALVMWRVVHSPFGLCLRTVRDNFEGGIAQALRPVVPLVRLHDPRCTRPSGASSWPFRPATSTPRSPTGHTRATSCS